MKNLKNKFICHILCFAFIFFAIGLLCNNLNKIAFAEDSSLTEETATIKVTKGDNVKYYSNFSDSLSSIEEGSTIKFLKDADICSMSNKTITLDINGKTISGDARFNYVNLTVIDSVNFGTINGKIDCYFSKIIINAGIFSNKFLSTTGTTFTINAGYISELYAVNDSINILGGVVNHIIIYSQNNIHLSGGVINSFTFQGIDENFSIINKNYCYTNLGSGNPIKIKDMTTSTKVMIKPCEHYSFSDSICDYCNYECMHENSYDINGLCSVCEYQCPHENFDSNGICLKCHYQCPHASYDSNSLCKKCHHPCQHLSIDSYGTCLFCGYVCLHDNFDSNGICTNCSYHCLHSTLDENYNCTKCNSSISTIVTNSSTSKNEKYLTLKDAFNNLQNNDKITLYKNINENSTIITSSDFTIDLNGYSIPVIYIQINNKVTVFDTKGNGSINIMTYNKNSDILIDGDETTSYLITAMNGKLQINRGIIKYFNTGSRQINTFLPENHIYIKHYNSSSTPVTWQDSSINYYNPDENEYLTVEPCSHNDFDDSLNCLYCNKELTINEVVPILKNDLEKAKNELQLAIEQKANTETLNEKIDELNQAIENTKLACNNYADEKDTTLKNELLETIENTKTDAINSANEVLTSTKNELIDLINNKANTETLNKKIDELNQAIENAKLACNNYADEKDIALKNELLENIKNAKTDAINSANEVLTSTKNELIDLINNKANTETLNEKIDELNQAIENAKLACNNYADEKDTALKNELLETIENAKSDAINSANEVLSSTKNELIDLINNKANTETLNEKIDELNQAIENAKLACNNYADEKDTALKNELLENIETSKSALQNSIDALAKRLTTAEIEITSNANQIKTLKITLIITIIAFIVLMGSGFTVLYLMYKKKQVSK